MNKLKLLEAMNMIDDELIKEAEMPSDTVSEAETGGNANVGLTASGVEVYHRPEWQRFTAIAAALILTVGLTGVGAHYMKTRCMNVNDNNIIESETIAPVTNNGDIVTTDNDSMESASTATTDANAAKQNGTTVTASSDKKSKVTETKTTGKDSKESTTSAKESNIYINTDKTESGGAKTSKTTTKQNSGKGTTTTTTAPKNSYVRPTVEVPSDGRMTENELLQFVKYFGNDMTWSDFEPYQHEDIGSGQYVWRIPVYDNNKQKFTLLVCGMIDKKPSGIFLYRGTDTNTQDRLDILNSPSDLVFDFLYPERMLPIGLLEDYLYSSDSTIAISSPGFKYKAFLGYSETKQMIDLIKNLEIVNIENSAWQTSSTMNYDIITMNTTLDNYQIFSVRYPYIIIDGTGYKATDSSMNALSAFCKEKCESRQTSRAIEVNGVWCWYDSAAYNDDLCDKTDSVTIKQFPDMRFDFLGNINTIAVSNTDGNQFAKVDTQFDAYFADINGDGYPEYCSTYDWDWRDDNVVIAVEVWDIHNNNWLHILASPDEYDYDLYEENGELFVRRDSVTSRHGEKGRLRIDGEHLVFVPVE